MPLLKIRQLGTVRSQDTLMKSLMIPTNEQVTDMQDSIKSMTVKGDSFGTPCDKRESKSKNLEEKLSLNDLVSGKSPNTNVDAKDYESHLLSELEHLKITVLELKAKLQDKCRVLTDVQKKRKEESLRYQKTTKEMAREHNVTKDELSRVTLALNGMTDKLFKAEMEGQKQLKILREKLEQEKAEQLEEKDAEIAWRKEKVDALKKQICDMLTGNSLVRQKQLDEMSKELEKVNHEADKLRMKIQTSKVLTISKTNDISCPECKDKLMAMKLKDIEIEQLKTHLRLKGFQQ